MNKPHPDEEIFRKLFPALEQLQALAEKHGIHDIFQDNGGKILQVILKQNLTILPGREGNDAKDQNGKELELKSVNINLTRSFSTNHHVNQNIIDKYRQVDWIFAVYCGIKLQAIYRMTPDDLEPYFTKWEQKWQENKRDINNPKIPLTYVQKNARLLYEENCQNA